MTRADRKRVADALKAEFDEAKEGFEAVAGTSAFEAVVQRRALQVDVDDALRQPESLLEEVFGQS